VGSTHVMRKHDSFSRLPSEARVAVAVALGHGGDRARPPSNFWREAACGEAQWVPVPPTHGTRTAAAHHRGRGHQVDAGHATPEANGPRFGEGRLRCGWAPAPSASQYRRVRHVREHFFLNLSVLRTTQVNPASAFPRRMGRQGS
jgi:hypothetical protein